MSGTRMLRPLAALLAATVVVFGYSAPTVAQSTDQDTQARIRILQERIDALGKELKGMKEEQGKTEKVVGAADKRMNTFMKGFFGTLDASMDYTTKGMNGMVAYPFSLAPGVTSPTGPFVQGATPKAGPFGRVGWLASMASNGSNIGYRGTHQIGTSKVDFIYQVATAINVTAAPGLQDTWTKSSNTVQGAIGLGDTYLGFQGHSWGKLKFGEMFMPYKTSTDRLNPFAGQLGDYSTVMANTGGDNRVEFGTRFDHAIIYNSPTMMGFSFDAMFAPGQNITYNNVTTPLGSPDCTGGNAPGSGNLFLNCDDGGFGDGWNADIRFERDGLYLTAAWELHRGVNRNSDGIGSNSPYYNYLLATNSPLLDFNTYNTFAAEYP